MILEYHRPASLEEALRLLARNQPKTLPLGGGTYLSRKVMEDVAVVDLQALGLDFIQIHGSQLEIGAMARMTTIIQDNAIPAMLRSAVEAEYPLNLREMTSLGGAIASNDGRSALLTALLALDARLVWLPGENEVALGNYLPLRHAWNEGKLIRSVLIPANSRLAIESVARTPLDRPVMIAAICQWPSGRTRVSLGGFGQAPILAADGPDATGADLAARNAYLLAEDEWASAEYRSQMAYELVRKLLHTMKART